MKYLGRFIKNLVLKINKECNRLPNTYNYGYQEISPPRLICPYLNESYLNDDLTDSLNLMVSLNKGGQYLNGLYDQNRFNRANLLNIGFYESLKINPKIDCFIFHDVDIIPLNLDQIYICTNQPKHLCSYLDKFRFVLIYPTLFGGVVTINRDQFELVNGYSNLYDGWGGEDDDFFKRVQKKFDYIQRYSSTVARCLMIPHDSDQQLNEERVDLLRKAISRSNIDGLSNLNQTYTLEAIEFNQFYTKIKVKLRNRQK
ncbi:Beta-1, 4-galactosyltransferase 1 [Sarcoptes scabiei]|uniref:Beta-1,4-galactosyltransferase 1 n=1 Tax=Sarcoptes scabiei TaxID=52283 RepID=A0A834R492_SARSC|nr:Beta-1, 4-galactosyltransferase 1 [Sarcoptes scabiei]